MSVETKTQNEQTPEAIAAAAAAKAAAAPKPTIDENEYNRAIAEAAKHRKEAEKLKAERDEEKTTKMKADNQWKELAEANEIKAKEAAERATRVETSYLGEKKFSAVKTKCLELGIVPAALDDLEQLDMSGVTVETTSTGKINILGADKFAERVKTLKPHWFAGKGAPAVNTGGQRVVNNESTEVTVKDVLAAQTKGHKTGDYSEYNDLHKKLQQQRVAARSR